MNKWIFEKLDFKFPLSVSCVHFICSAIGAYSVIKVRKLKPLIEVEPEDRWRRIFPMSFVISINIVLNNVLGGSRIPTVLQCLVWRKHFNWRIWTSLVPIVGGILLTSVTYQKIYLLRTSQTTLGCMSTSTKTILAESLLHGYKFDSINIVYYLAPFATMIMGVPAIVLEGIGVMNWFHNHSSVFSSLIIIFSFRLLPFCLNFSVFYVIHSTTAVTFNVAGNLKVGFVT
ncbi:UDP-galactose transporter 1 [Camellia lanceoleosa]|uniref:UDP-galactose transporter 1 n=1 Tax=Camellia lanceoleosa TaxID=1840588 RepID=A0ACC0J3Q0_9ERIC|nr:UDP-galactose transporter 1 [Camellia lanceoleosa]